MTRFLLTDGTLLFPSVWLITACIGLGGPAFAQNTAAESPAKGATAQPQQSFGAIAGVIRNAGRLPVSGAMVTVLRTDGKGIWTTISGSDGIYSIPNIAPGEYKLTAQAQGYANIPGSIIQVTGGDAARMDLSFAANSRPASAAISQNSPKPAAGPVPANTNAAPGMLSRIVHDMINPNPPKHQPVNTASLKTPPASAFDTASAVPSPAIPANPGPQGPTASAAPAPQQEANASAPTAVDNLTPFADYDWTWLNGNTRQHDSPLDSKYFSGEFRADTFWGDDFNQPIDHSMGGSSEVFRSGEVQLEDLSIGGDFHDGQMRGRVLALFGMFSATTVRNDPSPAVGQWDVRAAYKYISEAYGGYHFNVQHGINVDAGIFVSYVGLFSYHNFDNWAYQPSYVSSNTPWFFNGVRIQWFPTNHLKIEPWIINGWQSYNKMNGHPGLGGQLKYTPYSWMNVILNQYGYGEDTVGAPNRQRYHTDDSIEIKYYDHPKDGNGIDKMAFTFTGDAGCESGDGVTCRGGKAGPRQDFLGYMAYNRWWWHKDLFAFTLGGGQIDNPGRYLTLVLPINGADAISGTPYFPEYPGATFKAYDGTATFDWMPSQFFTFRTELGYRHTNVPYWSGRHGITPPGGNNGSPADFVCANGSSSGQTVLGPAEVACGGGINSVWFPDLREGQGLLSFAIMVKL